ncbi:CRISPR-associated endonuclease Cas2 [Haliangium ochraceum]|uniref:CRISPR-associated endoribonuclease Cas2 n=1 Tax=Haliangium ochraceum (strain DSM 14365 / JCM 11303 / SMP-2) TaxID=502025 RepID=D0LSX0_HALO1|nr:CRISPR-associated endonuclease Cas2 [Haliangium ochraceum]ACY17342.1 CRISPR-associated protein Cas2 [Haliangium ochraceum DSM 14365]
MSNRTTFIVCYDICDARRLRLVYKVMRGYGQHLQYSVFRCDLSASERVKLATELEDIVHHGDDQVMFVPLGPPEGFNATNFETIGRPMQTFERHAVVV